MNNDALIDSLTCCALEAGFDYIGFTKAAPASSLFQEYFNNWIERGNNASMSYLERNREFRFNPSLLHQGTRSIISLLINYNSHTSKSNTYPFVSRYAYGEDYHDVARKRLTPLTNILKKLDSQHQPRIFTDSAPIPDRYLAHLAGLGFIGKNTCLIHPTAGSWFFIAHVFTSIEIHSYTSPIESACGSCMRCINACPFGAISEKNGLDSNKCIAYWTIETKENCPNELQKRNPGWIFGCDICQQVCPYNKKAPISSIPEFVEPRAWHSFDLDSWKSMSETDFTLHFDKSPLKRCGYNKLKSNIAGIAIRV